MAGLAAAATAHPIALIGSFGVEARHARTDLPEEDLKSVEAVPATDFKGGDSITLPGLDHLASSGSSPVHFAANAPCGSLKNRLQTTNNAMSRPIALPGIESDQESAFGVDFGKCAAAATTALLCFIEVGARGRPGKQSVETLVESGVSHLEPGAPAADGRSEERLEVAKTRL